MTKKIFNLALLFALSISVFPQQKSTDDRGPNVERLHSHIAYLASDKLEGRRTGTSGADMAAEYIAGEFQRYGLRPGVTFQSAQTKGSFLQPFPYVAGVEMGANNVMLFTPGGPARAPADSTAIPITKRGTSLDLQLKEDWEPLLFSTNGRVENLAATFVGYGITAPDLKHDDYQGADLSGRIAVALSGTPDGDNPHGEFGSYSDVRWKATAAKSHGAKALVVIAGEENFLDDPLLRLRYDNAGGDAGLPVAAISRQAAARILSAGGLAPLPELEKALRTTSSTVVTPSTDGSHSLNKGGAALVGPLQNLTLSISTDLVRRQVTPENVVGVLDGADPKLKDQAVVIGAHFDHLGRGGEGSLAAREGEIHHGADDNASGVAGMLELARLFSAEKPALRRTIIFIGFSGEEEGLLGSNFYVNHPVIPISQTVAMINMDMIGRLKDNRLIVGGIGTATQWREWIASANLMISMQITAGDSAQRTQVTTGMPIVIGANHRTVVSLDPELEFKLTLNEDGYGPSDHSSFYAKKVPVLFFWTGTHDDYHKPTDTADKINYNGEVKIVSFIAHVLRSIDASEARPAYATARSETSGRSMGFRVYLGTIPNYSESTDGLKLDGVRDDSPASRAGLKAGDRVVRLAGRDVRNVYDYTAALGEMKAAQEYEVEIVRSGEHLTLKITPAARK